MPLVEAKCTNCGASLRIDSSMEAAVCEHCSTPFIVQKAINHYNTSINMTGGVVQVGENSLPQLLQNADTFTRLNDAASLVSTYRRITELYPDNEEGWWGYYSSTTNTGRHMRTGCDVIAGKALVIVSDPSCRKNIEEYLERYGEWADLVARDYYTVPARAVTQQGSRKLVSLLCAWGFGITALLAFGSRSTGLAYITAAVSAVSFLCRKYFRTYGYLCSARTSLADAARRAVGALCAQHSLTFELPDLEY